MENLTILFKLLSDQTRLRIILLLSQKEFCVCQLCDILEEAQPKISKNLSKLRDLDLVSSERREKFIFYRLKDDHKTLNGIIEDIFKNSKDYPQIESDQKRQENAPSVLVACGFQNTKKVKEENE